jgi:hypothetical protein
MEDQDSMNKKAQKNLKDLSLELQRSEGIVMVLVYSAGIGRMQFKAEFANEAKLDRQDGDDERPDMTYETPWEALRAFADHLENTLAKEAWEARLDALRSGK